MKNFVAIAIPPGIVSNGTEYSRRGRWIDGSRVRWHNNALRPIGGWSEFLTEAGPLNRLIPDPLTEVARSAMSYRLNDGTSRFAIGTNERLLAFGRSSQTIYDITPTDFIPRSVEAAGNTGYGSGDYGEEAYGTERTDVSDDVDVFSWVLKTWGQNLLAAPRGTPSYLYEWAPDYGNRAVTVANAPVNFDCFHVTSQRIVMTAGAVDDPRIIKWSASEDNTDWTPTQLNQAGFQRLDGNGRFKAILTVQDRYLLVSENDAYIADYLGPPYVFGFNQAGVNCGTIAPAGVVAVEDFAVWPGKNSFFLFDGTAVRRLECDVMDSFFAAINSSQETKTFGFVNPGWSEVWWLYQEGAEDLDSYIFYNWVRGDWGIGKLQRTAAGGSAATGGLFMVGVDGYVYQHEQDGVAPVDLDNREVFIESGPIEISSGSQMQYMDTLLPDYISNGEVEITLIGRNAPTGPETRFGPYTVSYPDMTGNPVPIRAYGRAIRLRVEGKDGLWTQGNLRIGIKGGGSR